TTSVIIWQSNTNLIKISTLYAQSEPEDIIPEKFSLYQNYPNPFNPYTEIGFDLPSPCNVKLEIFNIMGQKVATLIDKNLEAGHHTLQWDASNQASGVYFYKITAGDIVETKKMVLLK
ncbi:MAG: T9SS type A sorting domain-containing protein, partial [candidate division Zixibacteria bacterium]|nr:T9SS type A sorting domain-containing protein [candidate division Zixibacteria bacterium]